MHEHIITLKQIEITPEAALNVAIKYQAMADAYHAKVAKAGRKVQGMLWSEQVAAVAERMMQ